MITKKTEILIVKYVTKSANITELNDLRDWINVPNNYPIFKEYVRTHYSILYTLDNQDIDKAREQLLLKIKKEKSILKLKRFKSIAKYAAAVIIILGLGYIYKQYYINHPKETTAEIVKKTIEPGTDKATLTLANGSQIILEKGNPRRIKNASSNGEMIIYNQGKQDSKEVAYNYLTIPRGGQFHLKLSDATEVWLNSETKLKYPVHFIEGETRKVELVYGEAYFDVSPSIKHGGAKFKVLNQSQEVEVMGTAFNIKAYKDEANVYTTLVEGKIAISYKDKKQNLIPFQQSMLNFDKNILLVKTVDVYNEISWKEGVFSFEDKPMKEIMKVLSRWYDVDVIFKNKAIEDEEFIGILDKNQKIEDILTSIENFGKINSYEIKDKKVILE